MRIDIDLARIERQVEHVARMATVVEHISEAEPYRIAEHSIAHRAAVDEPELQIRLRARGGGQAQPSREAQRTGRLRQRYGQSAKIRADDTIQTLRDRIGLECGRQVQDLAPVMTQPHGYRMVSEPEPLDLTQDMAEFGGRRAHELAPRRHVIEQIAHLHARADRVGRGLQGALYAAIVRNLPRLLEFEVARDHAQARDGGNRGQRLAAKAETGDILEVLERRDLAGRVACECERKLIGAQAAAIVAHANQSEASALDVDVDVPRARVERVFE